MTQASGEAPTSVWFWMLAEAGGAVCWWSRALGWTRATCGRPQRRSRASWVGYRQPVTCVLVEPVCSQPDAPRVLRPVAHGRPMRGEVIGRVPETKSVRR
jgi:hypothetical protein